MIKELADITLNINHQAWAIAHFLAGVSVEGVACTSTAPWYNGRERGFVFSYCDSSMRKVLHIAVFEHRNGDSICALKWTSNNWPMNPPTLLSDGELAHPTNHKHHDIAFRVDYGMVGVMADWIKDQVEEMFSEEESSS